MSLGIHKPLVEYYNLTGTPYFTLAFVLYSSVYNGPAWAGSIPLDAFVDEVKELREAGGGDVIIAFGGAVGPYLCQQAKTPEQLAQWYIQVIDTYNATYLDFDIEAGVDADKLADALLILQKERPSVRISFTLPSDPGAGLVGSGYSIIQTMVQKGVVIDRVNPMTMDYYWTPANADNAISVAEHVFKQLKQIYPDKSDDEIWGMIGLTPPMIGTNDDKSVFSLQDAEKLVDWAIQYRIRSLAFWSVDRDHPGPTGEVSPIHRGNQRPPRLGLQPRLPEVHEGIPAGCQHGSGGSCSSSLTPLFSSFVHNEIGETAKEAESFPPQVCPTSGILPR
ncbi:hypothetical protein [Thermococcus sp. JCM 11816]|uniref:chitinase n=1 Tax=Thermococcus sp. (strain JCM 11816 / KS-1) TaxID=1295125 RepID=UPI0006D0B531